MIYPVVCLAALIAAALTLFSGFGLGTLLMPVLAIFFPIEAAVAATALVHLANNLFKVAIFGRYARGDVVWRFALPAGLFAIAGAWLLGRLAAGDPWFTWTLAGRLCEVSPVKLLVAAIIASFALMELSPRSGRLGIDPRWLPLGGALSGFFGGLSGHQGALRTAFLSRVGLGKEALLGTMIVAAVVVDVTRLLVYGIHTVGNRTDLGRLAAQPGPIAAAAVAAFLGSWIATRLVRRVTLDAVHRLIGILLVLFAVALGAGIV